MVRDDLFAQFQRTLARGIALSQSQSIRDEVSSRRRQLLLAGPVGATLASLPSMSDARAVTQVGVLMPQSEMIPGSRASWLQGFESELRNLSSSAGPSIVLRTAQYSPGPTRAIRTAQSMLDAGCHLLTGLFSCELADQIALSNWANDTKFIVADLGAKSRRRPNESGVYRVGPSLWKHAYAAGQHQATLGARTALVASSFYESGFDLVEAYRAGFIHAGGSKVDIVVTGTPDLANGDLGLTRVSDALSAHHPDAMFALYSGHDADAFVMFAEKAALPGKLNLPIAALSPFIDSLSRHARAKASPLRMTIVLAKLIGDEREDSSIFANTGRAAAIAMIRAAAGRSSIDAIYETSGPADLGGWRLFVDTRAVRELHDTSAPALRSELALCDDLRLGEQLAYAGWFAPYGA